MDYAINPFVAGVYAGNPSELSVRAAFPKLYALEEKFGGLLKGTIKGARERRKRPDKARLSAKLFAFKSGMGILPTTIAEEFGEAMCYNVSVAGVKLDKQKFVLNFSSSEKKDSDKYDAIWYFRHRLMLQLKLLSRGCRSCQMNSQR